MHIAVSVFLSLLVCLSAHADPVIAKLDGEAVRAAEVAQFVEPAGSWIGVEPPPDPRREALERTLRVRLFALEARRRGIAAPEGPPAFQRAHLHQALIRDELERRDIRLDAVDTEQARAFFAAHRNRILEVDAVTARAIVVEDRALAASLLQQAARTDAEGFGQLAAEHSVDRQTRENQGLLGTFDHNHSHDEATVGVAVARLVYRLNQPGQVGLAASEDGRYYVLRAEQVELKPQPWDEELERRVKHLLVYEQRGAALAALFQRLRAQAAISVDEDALALIPDS